MARAHAKEAAARVKAAPVLSRTIDKRVKHCRGFPQRAPEVPRTAGNQAFDSLLRANLDPGKPHRTVPVSVARVISSPGQPMDSSDRLAMESSFGYDFGQVRVHTDGRASDSACLLGADAYAVGSHIVFAPGQYTRDSMGGIRLLAHELAHVIQQARSPSAIHSNRLEVNNSLEAQADHAANEVVGGRSVNLPSSGLTPAVQYRSRRRQIGFGKFRNASSEAELLRSALRYASVAVAKNAVDRFLGFSAKQRYWIVIQWRTRFTENLITMVRAKLDEESAGDVRAAVSQVDREYRAWLEGERRQKAEKTERMAARQAEQVAEKELNDPTTSLGSFLSKKYGKLSPAEQRGVRGLLYFVSRQRVMASGWLRPGNQYSGQFENRWYLGTQLDKKLWLDNKLNVYRLSVRDELLEGMIKAVAGALPWVPILQGVAIFATIVVGGVVAAPAGAAGAIGRAGLAAGRFGLAAGRATMRVLGGELALFGGWLRSLGSGTLGWYLTNAKLGNEIGLFAVGTILSVEGDVRKLRAIFTDPTTIFEVYLVFKAGGALGEPRQRVVVPTRVLPSAEQNRPGRLRVQITGPPKASAPRSGRPSETAGRPMVAAPGGDPARQPRRKPGTPRLEGGGGGSIRPPGEAPPTAGEQRGRQVPRLRRRPIEQAKRC